MRHLKKDCLVLLVDLQARLMPALDNRDALLQRVLTLVRGARALGLPILLTEHCPAALGSTLPTLQVELGDSTPFRKTSFSCCDEPGFTSLLQPYDRRTILLAGAESHVCVLQTAVDLKALGYTPVLLADAVGSRKALDRELALERCRQEGIGLASVESILFELCRRADKELLRPLLSVVKPR